jgi:peptide/nickel transport system substrate-binding protein
MNHRDHAAGQRHGEAVLCPHRRGQADPKVGGTLVVGVGADATGLDPELVMNNESGFPMSLLYDRLVGYKPGTTEVTNSGLAESWEISPDGLTYTFHLRKGVKFTDGTAFNAQAAAADFARVVDSNHKYYFKKLEAVNSFATDTFSDVAKVEAVDENTLKFTLKAPYAPFLTDLGMVWSGVMNPKVTEQYGFESGQHPVGTGPFKLVEWVKNDHITLEANKDYWKGRPYLDKVIFKVVPENNVRVLKLQGGELDVILDVGPEDYAKLKGDAKITLLEQPGLTVNGVGLPCDTAPFNDKRVRQALNYATDKKTLDETLYKGLAVEMTQLVPAVDWSYDPSIKGYPYDPQKAKDLLAQAGFPNGFKTKLLIYPNPRGYNPIGGQLGVALQEQWKKVGVEVTIEQLEWATFLKTIRSGDYHFPHLRGWSGDNGDPDNFLYTLNTTNNIPVGNTSHYSNKVVDDLLDQGVKISDPAKRKEIYKQANQILVDDAPWVMINSTKQVRATAAKVKGVTLNPLQMLFDFNEVYIQK